MTENIYKVILPKTYTVVKLPMVEEIKEKGISSELRTQLLDPNSRFNSEVEAWCLKTDCTHSFYLKLTIGYKGNLGCNGYYFAEGEESPKNITAYEMSSIGQARRLKEKFESNIYWVCNEVGACSKNTRRKNAEVITTLRSWIGVFEKGQSVNQTVNFGR